MPTTHDLLAHPWGRLYGSKPWFKELCKLALRRAPAYGNIVLYRYSTALVRTVLECSIKVFTMATTKVGVTNKGHLVGKEGNKVKSRVTNKITRLWC